MFTTASFPMIAARNGSMSGFTPAAPLGARDILALQVAARRPSSPIVRPREPVLSERTISCCVWLMTSDDMRQQFEPASVAVPPVFGMTAHVASGWT